MGFIKEFKEFAIRGNVVDLAIGVIIGTAFGRIVQSLVNDIMMPVIGRNMGVHFGDLFIALDGQSYPNLTTAKEVGAPVVAYGSFIQTIIDFIIIALSVFIVVKMMNRMRRKQAEQPKKAESTRDQVLLEEIRDILKSKN